MILCPQTHRVHKNITYSQLTTELSSLSKWLTVCIRQDLGSITPAIYYSHAPHLPSLLRSQSLFQKCELFLIKLGVKVNGQHCRDVLISHQMLGVIKCTVNDNLSFSKTTLWCILHSAQSVCCTAKLSTSFLLISGPVTVQRLSPLAVRCRSHIAAWDKLRIRSQNKLSQQPVEDWQCRNTAFERKDAFFLFRHFATKCRSTSTWGGKIVSFDCLLSQWHFCKKLWKSVHVCQSCSKHVWNFLGTQCILCLN